MGGRHPLEGRVELCYDEVWGTVCNRDWADQDATVVCRQLQNGTAGENCDHIAHNCTVLSVQRLNFFVEIMSSL